MDTASGKQVTVKLFIGCAITPELKMHLNHSVSWKQASIMRGRDQDVLIQTNFQHKAYIGLYTEESCPTLLQVLHFQHFIHKQIAHYCPRINNVDALSFFIFPQVFVH